MLRTLRFIWHHPLNSDGRFAALLRFVRWQISARLVPYITALPFVNDTSLFVRRGMTGATGNWYCGLHEYKEMGFLLHLLRPEDYFVDVGANVGSYTVLAAGAVGAKVIAVEPIPSTFSALESNILLNGIQHRVTAKCIGLADAPGYLEFVSELDTMNHVVTSSENLGASIVEVCTLDQLTMGYSPIAIKIDVEGYEFFVLEGADRTLRDRALLSVILETNQSGLRYGIPLERLVDTMASYGFAAHTYDPIDRRLVPTCDGMENTIFVRDVQEVEERLRQAPRYQLVTGDL